MRDFFLLRRFIDLCATEKIFDGVKKILIAVSGGADSLALAELMINSRQRFKLELCIAHFEHGLRGQESIDDATFVKNFAEERGIKFIGGKGDVKKFAAQEKISIETAARILRYEFLTKVKSDFNCDAIALAHHADDQAETILMRLLRGATSTGLSAMKFRTLSEDYGLLIRPLLRFRKIELENFCRKKFLSPRLDSTNLKADATRNKIRLELIPELEKFNPALVETLCRLAEVTAEEIDFIDAQAEKIFPVVVRDNSIVRAEFLKLHPALQRVVIKKFLAQVAGSTKDFGFVHFEGVRKVLLNNLSGVELPKNFRADLRKGKLIIKQEQGRRN
ncbi:MAG: tRNA lysidine(34) synthetase TilS [Selenomonadaceae bacterium]|nr:tRNA lysidine(34) synthetase TilS [Selenomonadaceae bacterium]